MSVSNAPTIGELWKMLPVVIWRYTELGWRYIAVRCKLDTERRRLAARIICALKEEV